MPWCAIRLAAPYSACANCGPAGRPGPPGRWSGRTAMSASRRARSASWLSLISSIDTPGRARANSASTGGRNHGEAVGGGHADHRGECAAATDEPQLGLGDLRTDAIAETDQLASNLG